jgi:UTP:GlnB (protein PII) uridylyltransferase
VYAAGMDIHMAQVFTLFSQEGTSDAAAVGRVLSARHRELVDGAASENGASENGVSLSDATTELQADAADGRGIVLDRLYVARDGRPLTSAQCARLAASLREVLLGEKTVEEVLEAAGKDVTTPLAPQRISLRNDLSDEHSVLTVVNDNVPGLLYYVTSALASLGLDIHSAKITSWAGRAEDAFYVTRRNADESSTNDGTNDGMAVAARDQKISDDEIKVVLEEVQRRLQKPVARAQAVA